MSYPFSSLKAPEFPLHGPFTIQLSEPEIKMEKVKKVTALFNPQVWSCICLAQKQSQAALEGWELTGWEQGKEGVK